MRRRFLPFWFFLIAGFGVLVARLFQLTVLEGGKNRMLANEQRIRLQKISAPRGIIFDRNGKPLVRNEPIFKKCSATGGSNVPSARAQGEGKCQIVTREEALSLEEQGKDADLLIEVGRQSLFGEAMAHLLGYLGEVNEKEVPSYKLGDFTGRTGIEEQYEGVLRGMDGGELVETDTQGKTLRKIGRQEPVSGKDIKLTIDAGLQVAAYQALKGKKGAVVAQNPQTGEVLVLVSSPSFNPNNISEDLLNSPESPFLNRAISGAYPPGSTFKIVTAVAGLEEGKISPQIKVEDPGEIVIGKYRYANWYFTQYGKTEGTINLVQAIKRSTDTFFYKVGEWVGATKLIDWGKTFGLGELSGIDLPGEVPGFLPDPTSGDWFLGNTYHLAIGQGYLGLTPLEVNMMTSVIASGGKWCKPYIRVKEQDCHNIGLKPETIRLITEGMKEVCSAGGTAFPFFDFKPQVACKTGTAEFDDPQGWTHAWFTAFAPADKPEIVVTVLVEAGGEGSSVAAPIAKKVLEEYFRPR